MNIENAMTAEQHIAALDTPDLLVDARVDRNLATTAEIRDFVSKYAVPWQQAVPSVEPEIRHRADVIMDEYRQVFASRNIDLPYAEEIVTDRVGITHDSRTQIGDVILPPNVPVALWRNGFEFHRQYCWGIGGSSLKAAYVTVSTLPVPLEEYDLDKSGGCDFTFVPAIIHRSLSRVADPELAGMRAPLMVWPIQRGDQVLLLKICDACIGAMFAKYSLVKSEIRHPWERSDIRP